MKIKISPGNIKMGAIPSVSLPAGVTCRKNCLCWAKCYAHKLERIRKSVREAYESNYKLLLEEPDTYWREVNATVMLNRYFRFHVSGDIVDMDYLVNMVKVAKDNPHCQILCFTKQYELVNEYLDNHKEGFPSNLHIIFSVWDGMECPNPHNLPEAHVRYRDGHTTARDDAYECGGNCADCAVVECGCWVLEDGEQIIFNEH